jgi:hypothetical protein
VVIELDEIEMFDEVVAMYQGPKTSPYDALVSLLIDAKWHTESAGFDWDQLVADAGVEGVYQATVLGRS